MYLFNLSMRNAGPQMTIEERMLTPDEKEFLLCVERYFLGFKEYMIIGMEISDLA